MRKPSLSASSPHGPRRPDGEENAPDPRCESLVAVLARRRGNISEVARELGKDRKQVQRWMERFGLTAASFRWGDEELGVRHCDKGATALGHRKVSQAGADTCASGENHGYGSRRALGTVLARCVDGWGNRLLPELWAHNEYISA